MGAMYGGKWSVSRSSRFNPGEACEAGWATAGPNTGKEINLSLLPGIEHPYLGHFNECRRVTLIST
jgi:hypothetical protein